MEEYLQDANRMTRAQAQAIPGTAGKNLFSLNKPYGQLNLRLIPRKGFRGINRSAIYSTIPCPPIGGGRRCKHLIKSKKTMGEGCYRNSFDAMRNG